MTLSWNQFKAAVDKKIADQGLNPDDQIWFIEILWPEDENDFHVGRDEESDPEINHGLLIAD